MAEQLKENELNEVSGGEEYIGYKDYYVQPGDTLTGIASHFHTNYLFLANLNNIQYPYVIYINQKLLVPIV